MSNNRTSACRSVPRLVCMPMMLTRMSPSRQLKRQADAYSH